MVEMKLRAQSNNKTHFFFFVVNVVVVVLALFQKANQFLHLNKIIIARRKAWLVLNQEHNVSRDALCQIPFKLAVY